jgi:hypothetical protein
MLVGFSFPDELELLELLLLFHFQGARLRKNMHSGTDVL